MTFHDLSPDAPIHEKIAWARECFRRSGDRLLQNPDIGGLLGRLRRAIDASRRAMRAADIPDQCRECERDEGGSCCGAGLEDKYSGTLLLINLLLGRELPDQRADPSSCHFLGKEGCRLIARHVICINYLCAKITDRIDPEKISRLRHAEGEELGLLFLLNERIKKILQDDI